MCINHTETQKPKFKLWQPFYSYLLAIGLATFSAFSNIGILQNLGAIIAHLFVNVFKCISLPIIFTSIIVTVMQYNKEGGMGRVWKRTLLYTFSTTIVAASLACALYVLIQPATLSYSDNLANDVDSIASGTNYLAYLADLVPTNFLLPFIEHKVISVLLMSILLGASIRKIKNDEARLTISNFFKGVHEILLVITGWVVKIVPLGLYGFMTVTILELRDGVAMQGLAAYLAVIVLANLIQGLVILPLWLLSNGIRPLQTLRGMLPALSVAFFSKSSSGTLPITMETAEKNIGVDPKISRAIFPLCTTINMNGCAAFIFVTVIYLMQNHGMPITIPLMLGWIIISTIAAIGNAGIPMGCFFLSASLLASLNVPISILGLILPLYSLIDMLETALNVWSDSCVVKVVDHKEKAHSTVAIDVVGADI